MGFLSRISLIQRWELSGWYLGHKTYIFSQKKAFQNKKGGEVSTFFAPNLTMNLTYLCYGKSKIGGLISFEIKKTTKASNDR